MEREALALGREAYQRSAWAEAHARLVMADREVPLPPEDLEHSAIAAHLIGWEADRDERLARAHQSFLNAGDVESAARCAFWLGFCLTTAGEVARGGGWLARAKRLLDDAGMDSALRGYLLLPDGYRALYGRDVPKALTMFAEAGAIGRRFGDADLVVLGRHGEGRALIRLGRVREGVALLDEVMVAVTVGDLVPTAVGPVYCSVLDACYEIFDLRRAHEWTAAFADWCALQPEFVPFRGQCLIRRAEIMQLHGEWTNALAEACRACEEAPPVSGRPGVVGAAYYRRAELHRLRGELTEAEEAYKLASQSGRSPQPGLALLRFAQNQIEAAAAAIRRAASEAQGAEDRATVLHAAIDVLLAANNVVGAHQAASELEVIARAIEAPFLRAAAAEARGAVLRSPRATTRARCRCSSTPTARGPASARRTMRHEPGFGPVSRTKRWAMRIPYMLELNAARCGVRELGAAPDVARHRCDVFAAGAAGDDPHVARAGCAAVDRNGPDEARDRARARHRGQDRRAPREQHFGAKLSLTESQRRRLPTPTRTGSSIQAAEGRVHRISQSHPVARCCAIHPTRATSHR